MEEEKSKFDINSKIKREYSSNRAIDCNFNYRDKKVYSSRSIMSIASANS